MSVNDRKRTLALTAAVAAVGGLVLLLSGVLPSQPPPNLPLPPLSAEAREEQARKEREVAHLRALRRQYRWGIDNLLVNQSFVQVELDRLRFERRLMPVDDPERAHLERRLNDLPDLYRDYVANEKRTRQLLSEVEAELATKEAALAAARN